MEVLKPESPPALTSVQRYVADYRRYRDQPGCPVVCRTIPRSWAAASVTVGKRPFL
jgi:hypothetical protein